MNPVSLLTKVWMFMNGKTTYALAAVWAADLVWSFLEAGDFSPEGIRKFLSEVLYPALIASGRRAINAAKVPAPQG